MRILRIAAASLALACSAPTANADEKSDIAEIVVLSKSCDTTIAKHPNDWLGWRRGGGGYSDTFQFWDGEDAQSPSVLIRWFVIDLAALEYDQFCYRTDGTLAYVFSRISSYRNPNDLDAVSLEGRLYYNANGKLIRKLTQVKRAGKKADDPKKALKSLQRGCDAFELHLTLKEVRAHLSAEIGYTDWPEAGKGPPFKPRRFLWCEPPLGR